MVQSFAFQLSRLLSWVVLLWGSFHIFLTPTIQPVCGIFENDADHPIIGQDEGDSQVIMNLKASEKMVVVLLCSKQSLSVSVN